MAPRHIGAWLLKRWPLVGIFVILTALVGGFAFETFYSDGEVRILAQDPPPTPTLSFVVNTPTDDELHKLRAEYIKNLTATPRVLFSAKDKAAAQAVPTATPTLIEAARMMARSQAEFEYFISDRERTIYLEEIDKLIHMPESVIKVTRDVGPVPMIRYWCGAPDRRVARCPVTPGYELDMVGDWAVTVDSAGRVFLDEGEILPPFLSGLKVIYWP